MTVKLLWDQVDRNRASFGILHEVISCGQVSTRWRASDTHDKAMKRYFDYADAMRACGYTISARVDRPWSYEVRVGDLVVERVSISLN